MSTYTYHAWKVFDMNASCPPTAPCCLVCLCGSFGSTLTVSFILVLLIGCASVACVSTVLLLYNLRLELHILVNNTALVLCTLATLDMLVVELGDILT